MIDLKKSDKKSLKVISPATPRGWHRVAAKATGSIREVELLWELPARSGGFDVFKEETGKRKSQRECRNP